MPHEDPRTKISSSCALMCSVNIMWRDYLRFAFQKLSVHADLQPFLLSTYNSSRSPSIHKKMLFDHFRLPLVTFCWNVRTQYSCNTCFTTHKAGAIDSLVYDKAGTVHFPLIEHRCIGTPLTQFEFSYTTQVSWGVTQKVLFYDHDTSATDPQSRCNGSTIGVQSIHNKGAIIPQYRWNLSTV